MRLPLYIAGRYLFAKKSHGVINIISGISAAGMALGTAALILVLSVFNGFNGIIEKNLSAVEADLRIVPAEGKVFIPEGPAFDWLYDAPEAGSLSSVIADKVFISYEGRQSVVNARGVDDVYAEETGLELRRGDLRLAVIGSDLAWKLGINPKFLSPVDIWYPDRTGTISPSNPAASLHTAEVYPSKVMDIPHTSDAGADGTMIIPIGVMRSLTGYSSEVSAVEIRFADALTARQQRRFEKALRAQLGADFTVQDRYMQDEALYKMMRYEKAAIFLILLFIVIIVALNIFGSLSMLIIEKKEDMEILRAMGASDQLISKVFVLEGWLISLLGMVAGVVLGVGLALLQQHFGLVKMPGNFVVDAYPVVLRFTDVLLSAAGVALIGLVVALAPLRSR
ncbi:MAG: ABC transporter permease [Bacteroidales bacterium]|nr:ABC transporter permease [Bacteroidales bacterium]